MNKLDEATNLRNNGQEEKAIAFYRELIAAHEKEGYCWQMIGVCYNILEKPEEATSAIKKAIEIFTKQNDSFNLGCAYRDMGLTLLKSKQTEESIEWLEKSIKELSKTDKMGALGISQAKLGLAYFRSGNLIEARKYLENGLAAIRVEGDWFMEATSLLDLAKLDLAEGFPEKAVDDALKAQELITKTKQSENQKRRMAEIFIVMFKGYKAMKNDKMADKFRAEAENYLSKMPEDVAKPLREGLR